MQAKALNEAQKNWKVTKQELLAVVFSFKKISLLFSWNERHCEYRPLRIEVFDCEEGCEAKVD